MSASCYRSNAKGALRTMYGCTVPTASTRDAPQRLVPSGFGRATLCGCVRWPVALRYLPAYQHYHFEKGLMMPFTALAVEHTRDRASISLLTREMREGGLVECLNPSALTGKV